MSMPTLRLSFLLVCLVLCLPALADTAKNQNTHGKATPTSPTTPTTPNQRANSASDAEQELPPRDDIVVHHLTRLLDARGRRLTEAQRATYGKAIAGDVEKTRDNALDQLFGELSREERKATQTLALENRVKQENIKRTNLEELSRISARGQNHSPSPEDEQKIAKLNEALAISRQLIALYTNVADYLQKHPNP